MKTTLIKNLEKLRNNRIIKSYAIKTHENELSKGYKELIIGVSINDVVVVTKDKIYDPTRVKYGKVFDMLVDELEEQLMSAGIMALLSNRSIPEIPKEREMYGGC